MSILHIYWQLTSSPYLDTLYGVLFDKLGWGNSVFKIERGREGVRAILNELRIANFPGLLISSRSHLLKEPGSPKVSMVYRCGGNSQKFPMFSGEYKVPSRDKWVQLASLLDDCHIFWDTLVLHCRGGWLRLKNAASLWVCARRYYVTTNRPGFVDSFWTIVMNQV